jgi:hypothetical protein
MTLRISISRHGQQKCDEDQTTPKRAPESWQRSHPQMSPSGKGRLAMLIRPPLSHAALGKASDSIAYALTLLKTYLMSSKRQSWLCSRTWRYRWGDPVPDRWKTSQERPDVLELRLDDRGSGPQHVLGLVDTSSRRDCPRPWRRLWRARPGPRSKCLGRACPARRTTPSRPAPRS